MNDMLPPPAAQSKFLLGRVKIDLEKGEETAHSHTKELVNDLNRSGITVSKITLVTHFVITDSASAELQRLSCLSQEMSRPVSHKPPDDPEEDWEHVMWSDETKMEFFGMKVSFFIGRERMLSCIKTSCYGGAFLQR